MDEYMNKHGGILLLKNNTILSSLEECNSADSVGVPPWHVQVPLSWDSVCTLFSSFKTFTLLFAVFLTQKQYPLCKLLAERDHFMSKVSTNLHWIHYTAIGLERLLSAKIVYTVFISLSYTELVLHLERDFDVLMESSSHFAQTGKK